MHNVISVLRAGNGFKSRKKGTYYFLIFPWFAVKKSEDIKIQFLYRKK